MNHCIGEDLFILNRLLVFIKYYKIEYRKIACVEHDAAMCKLSQHPDYRLPTLTEVFELNDCLNQYPDKRFYKFGGRFVWCQEGQGQVAYHIHSGSTRNSFPVKDGRVLLVRDLYKEIL